MAYIISADKIKESMPGYEPAKSELFHSLSAKLADRAFEQALKERPEETVILMSGGAASGKSEYVSVYLEPKLCIVLDGTLPTIEGARIKIQKILKANKKVEIYAVMPGDFTIAYVAFLNRDRKFSDSHFFRTHSQSRATLLKITKEFPEIPIHIIISEYDQKNSMELTFYRITFHDYDRMIEFIRIGQYTEEYIRNRILKDNAA